MSSFRLNGDPVPVEFGRDGLLHTRLTARVGLRPGINLLRIEATAPGARLPVSARSQFSVTYPSTDLVTVSTSRLAGALAPRLRLPTHGLSTFTVSLNRRDVTRELGRPGADGSRRLELSAATGLRPGVNRIGVHVVMADGREQTLRRTVHLGRRRNIAGIRLLDAAQVGRRLRLDAGTSRLAGRQAAAKLHAAAVRWTLLSRPARSHVVLPRHGKRIAWTPDVPGDYLVRVTVGRGMKAGSALLTVTATYPSALVAFNSIDTGSPSALTINGTRYPVASAVQVNVFDRASLGWLSSAGYDATGAGLSALGSYLKALPDTDLVFVTHPSTSPAIAFSDLDALNNALGYIGGSFPGSWLLNMPGCWSGATNYCYQNSTGWYRNSGVKTPIGSFSVAGVPGMSAGQAWRATAIQSHTTEGRLSGYLTRGVPAQTGGVQSYVIVAGAAQYVQVDTCATGGPSACVIRVGDQTFAPAAGVNGFNVVTLDRTTLAPISHVTATSMGQLASALTNPTTLPVGRQLAPPTFVDDQRVAIVQSVGSGALPPSTANPYPVLDQFGATPELVLASLSHGSPYAMVGVADKLPWHGTATESSAVADPHQSGRVRAILSRGRDQLLTPTAGDPYGGANLDLYTTMYQDPTPWPYAGDPAIRYIANIMGLPADIRSGYTNGNTNFGAMTGWLASITCTDTAACGPNFDYVKNNVLLPEFVWVADVRTLIGNLESPFKLSGQSLPVDVQAVYNEVSDSIKPPADSSTGFDFLGMFLDITNLAAAVAFQSGFDDAGVSLGLFSAGGQFIADAITPTDGDSTDVLDGKVDQLDQQLAEQQTSAVLALDKLQAILESDAGKLKTVGTNVGTNPAWNWQDGTSLSESVTALNATSRAQSYAALIPPAWHMWNLKPDNVTQTTSDDVDTFKCIGTDPVLGLNQLIAPWYHVPAGNQLHAVTSVTSSQAVTSQVWTFANINTANFSYAPAYPSNTVTNPLQSLTDNLTSTNTLSGAFQYLPRWIRTTYNPPGHVVCSTKQPNSSTVAKSPPSIPNADAASRD